MEENLETISLIPLFYVDETKVSIGGCDLPNITE